MIKNQNKSLIYVSLFVALLLAFVFKYTGAFDQKQKPNEIETSDAAAENSTPPSQEAMAEPQVPVVTKASDLEDQKTFSYIMSDLSNCFDLKSSVGESTPLTIESVISSVQSELGPAVGQADRSMNWHLRNREGIERRLHMEITESDDGKIFREMKYFAVDNEGLPVPMELAPEKSNNPSDEVVNQMLKEGDVFFKEKAAYALFSSGARIEFTEKNGQLSDFEFQKGERFFRCQNLNARDACQCIQ